MPSLRLEPMDAADRAAFLSRQARDYAEAKARAGLWPRDAALARARAEISRVLEGPSSPVPHEFLQGLDPDGHVVGWLWTGPVPGERPERAVRWLYQITVDEPLRGRGLGRVLLQAAEAHLRERGVRELRLNVFTWNRAAVALYESSGYTVAAASAQGLEMRKRLG